jgi:hypothetical protein
MSRRNLWFCIAVLVAGCVPVTEPLSDVSKAEPERRLVGKWQRVDSTDWYEVDVPAVKGHPKGLMRAVYNGKVDDLQNTFWFFAATIGKHTYATVYLAPSDKLKFTDFREEGVFENYTKSKNRQYFIFKFTLDGDNLVVDGGTGTVVEELMKAEKIEKTGEFFKTSEGWLAKYLARNGPDKIFTGENKQEYRRAKK